MSSSHDSHAASPGADPFAHHTPEFEDPLPGPTWVVFIAIGVITAACALGVTGLYYYLAEQREENFVLSEESKVLVEANAEQSARLEGPYRREIRADNEGATAIVIPIDEAISHIVREAQGASLRN